MTTAGERLRAQQQAAAERRAAGAKPVNRPAQRAKPVRTTLDLPPDLHTEFARWRMDNAPELGRAKLTGLDVLTVLLRRLLADEKLQQEVMDDLRREGR